MNRTPNIAFFGSPELAAACLDELIGPFNVNMVVTRPDKEYGRGKKMKPTPVSEIALREIITVYRPQSIDSAITRELDYHNIHLIIAVAYGKILPDDIINYPEAGCLNLHASILPKYRGPSPLQAALLNGETETGVTVQIMKKELDAGDILAVRKIHVNQGWTAKDLMGEIVSISPSFLVETISSYLAGMINPEKQNENEATFCTMIRKKDGLIDWSEGADVLRNRIRAYNIWPVAFTYLDGKLLKIFNASLHSMENSSLAGPGKIVDVSSHEGIIVQTGRGMLGISELQLANKKRLKCGDFIRGCRNLKGRVLGSTPSHITV